MWKFFDFLVVVMMPFQMKWFLKGSDSLSSAVFKLSNICELVVSTCRLLLLLLSLEPSSLTMKEESVIGRYTSQFVMMTSKVFLSLFPSCRFSCCHSEYAVNLLFPPEGIELPGASLFHSLLLFDCTCWHYSSWCSFWPVSDPDSTSVCLYWRALLTLALINPSMSHSKSLIISFNCRNIDNKDV